MTARVIEIPPAPSKVMCREALACRMGRFPRPSRGDTSETVFVVYCAGPHCNGAYHAATRLAQLDRPVKMTIGGVTSWQAKGFSLEPS